MRLIAIAAFCVAARLAACDTIPLTLTAWTRTVFANLPCFDDVTANDWALHVNDQFSVPYPQPKMLLPFGELRSRLLRFASLMDTELRREGVWFGDGGAVVQQRVDADGLTDFEGHVEPVAFPYVQKLLLPADAVVAVFGDLHGSLHSILRELNSLAEQGYLLDDFHVAPQWRDRFFVLFLGDYVDRGAYGAHCNALNCVAGVSHGRGRGVAWRVRCASADSVARVAGIEVIFTLLELKLKNPDNVFMARGNHEDEVGTRAALAFRARPTRFNSCRAASQAVNKADFGGTFDDELRSKYADEPAESLRMVYRMYDLLPLSLFVAARPGDDAEPRATQTPVPFVQACHGGIEVGWNPLQFLQVRSGAAVLRVCRRCRCTRVRWLPLRSRWPHCRCGFGGCHCPLSLRWWYGCLARCRRRRSADQCSLSLLWCCWPLLTITIACARLAVTAIVIPTVALSRGGAVCADVPQRRVRAVRHRAVAAAAAVARITARVAGEQHPWCREGEPARRDGAAVPRTAVRDIPLRRVAVERLLCTRPVQAHGVQPRPRLRVWEARHRGVVRVVGCRGHAASAPAQQQPRRREHDERADGARGSR
jgi:hypothetical protein